MSMHVASFSSIEIAGRSGVLHTLFAETMIEPEQPLPVGASHAQEVQEGVGFE